MRNEIIGRLACDDYRGAKTLYDGYIGLYIGDKTIYDECVASKEKESQMKKISRLSYLTVTVLFSAFLAHNYGEQHHYLIFLFGVFMALYAFYVVSLIVHACLAKEKERHSCVWKTKNPMR